MEDVANERRRNGTRGQFGGRTDALRYGVDGNDVHDEQRGRTAALGGAIAAAVLASANGGALGGGAQRQLEQQREKECADHGA